VERSDFNGTHFFVRNKVVQGDMKVRDFVKKDGVKTTNHLMPCVVHSKKFGRAVISCKGECFRGGLELGEQTGCFLSEFPLCGDISVRVYLVDPNEIAFA
jgi:hypothetical protein